MRIEKTIVETIEREILRNDEGGFIDVTSFQTCMDDIPEFNPLHECTYYMPYNWRDVAESEDDPQAVLIDLITEAVSKANRTERKEVFDKIIKPAFTSGNLDCVEMDGGSVADFLDENAGNLEICYGDQLDLLAPLVNKYTDSNVYAVSVYTHSDSDFRLANHFHNAFLIIKKEMDGESDELARESLTDYTDYFNGSVYQFNGFETLQDAINDDDPYIHIVFGHDVDNFKNSLKDLD